MLTRGNSSEECCDSLGEMSWAIRGCSESRERVDSVRESSLMGRSESKELWEWLAVGSISDYILHGAVH